MRRESLQLIFVLCLGVTADCIGRAQAVETVSEYVRLGGGDLLAGIPGEGSLSLEAIDAWLNDPRNHRELKVALPVGLNAGLADARGLKEDPLTRAKIELGRQLFFDRRLSRDNTVSCASCHQPEHGYAAPTRVGIGVGGAEGRRNSPTAGNRLLSGPQFWDGRVDSLEAQAIAPIANPAEMGLTHGAVVDACRSIEGYRRQFERIFGGPEERDGVTIENAGRALAAFERALVSGPNRWDHHTRLRAFESAYDGELDDLPDDETVEAYASLKAAAAVAPLSESAERGAKLFFGPRTGCTQCHAGANLSDERYHNLGVGMQQLADRGDTVDWGRYEITKNEADRGAFKTPGLRNVAQTWPYMHDGSLATLAEVVTWYVEGGHDNPYLSPLLVPLDLDEAEQADLVAFLESLTGEWPKVQTERLPQ